MKMYHHKKLPLGSIHPIHNWRVANPQALSALLTTPEDEGKVALQETPRDLLVLLQYPNIWFSLITGEGPAPSYLAFVEGGRVLLEQGGNIKLQESF